MLVGVDENDSTFEQAGLTGGEKTYTLTINEMPSHTHTQNAHSHSANNPTLINESGSTAIGSGPTTIMGTQKANSWATGSTTATNQNTGGGASHNNLQPYYTVYMWYRSA